MDPTETEVGTEIARPVAATVATILMTVVVMMVNRYFLIFKPRRCGLQYQKEELHSTR